jgi:glycosyltransferase involved in cell wall biosynthesis
MPPRVSLIASTYRSGRFLPAWLENMASQSVWPDAELVVVANDPDDGEEGLLRDFSEAYENVRVLTVEREPLYRSWNRAISASHAPLLAIANVDDLRTPAGLEAQVRALEAEPRALFAYGPYAVSTQFPPEPATARPVAAVEFEREEFTRSMHAGPFFTWRRSSDPATTYFDEQLKVGGDFDLAVRLALHGDGVAVDEQLGFYYDGGTGLSTGGETQRIELAVLVLRYGIYDKVDVQYVPQASEYAIPQLLMPGGKWLPMSEVIPDYAGFLRDRRERWWPRPKQRGLIGKLVR